MADLRDSVGDFAQNIKCLNILILGKVGVGKSSLINAIFGEEIAKTGAGFSVTKSFDDYLLEEEGLIPIGLYDSAGCELGREKNFVDKTREFLDIQLKKGVEGQIHVAWYVVNASSGRFEPFEREIINNLYDQRIPVIIVLSQCEIAKRKEIDGIKTAINSLDFQKVYNIIEVSASPFEPLNLEPFGLDDVVQKTTKLLPKVLGDAFIARQVVDVKAKRPFALRLVYTSAITCFAAGFSPIPFTTPIAALTTQTALWNRIAALYKLDKIQGLGDVWNKITFSKEALTTLIATTIADLFVFDIFFTGIFAGGTAATYIVIVGFALTDTFEELAMKEVDGISTKEIENLLQEIFKKNFDKYKNIRIGNKSDLEKLRDKFLEG